MLKGKSLYFAIASAVLLFFFNNCNGVPYGGLIPGTEGKYYSANKTCSGSAQDYLEVTSKDDSISANYVIPCQNKSIAVNPLDVSVNLEEKYILYDFAAFAHESTDRGQSLDNYLIACRTTEKEGFNEIMMYKNLKSEFVLERVWASPLVSIERQIVERGSPDVSGSYVFEGDGVSISFRIGDDPTNIDYKAVHSDSSLPNLLCDNIIGLSADLW